MLEFYSQNGHRYEVTETQPFAFGRTSTFFRGRAPDGGTVCIKVFRKLEEVGPDLDEFLREIVARQRIQHPHVLPVLDYGVQESAEPKPFLILKYCRGGDLRELMARRDRFPMDEALAFLTPLASAIDFAHEAGLVHGDIKPENILFDDGLADVYLADFGTVKIIVVRARASRDPMEGKRRRAGVGREGGVHIPEGTELYLSPEELADGSQTELSDIYAFAFVTYEVLTGRLPIDPQVSPYRQMQAKVEGRIINPQKAYPKLSAVARDALLSGLNVDPGGRPGSAREFCNMLLGAAPAVPPKRRRSSRRSGMWSELPPSSKVAIITALIAALSGIVVAVIKIVPDLVK
jgi:eukaryotic-like serine/threonine-protein kinase